MCDKKKSYDNKQNIHQNNDRHKQSDNNYQEQTRKPQHDQPAHKQTSTEALNDMDKSKQGKE